MSDMYLGSQAPMYQNVHIRVRDEKTGRVRLERSAKNRITKLMLWGIARFLSGEFNDSTPDKIYEVIPRYLALGSNKPKLGDNDSSITTAVNVNDTRLLNEYTVLNSTGASEPVKRVNIQGRQHNKVTTHFSDNFIKLSLSTYISSEQFDGVEIGEAGLFSKEKDNNCLARVVFPTFTKQKGEVIDIQWDITLLSYGTTKYAENVSIDGPNKLTLGLEYTPYHIETANLGLFLFQDVDGNYENFIRDILQNPIFRLNETSTGSGMYRMEPIAGGKENWKQCLESVMLPYEADNIWNHIVNGCVLNLQNSQMYFNSKDTPTIVHLSDAKRVASSYTLLSDMNDNLLHDIENNQLVVDDAASTQVAKEFVISYIAVTENTYKEEYTGAKLRDTASPRDYVVVYKNDSVEYKVIDNQFYKRIKDSNDYEECNAFIYSNMIVNKQGVNLEYIIEQDTGKIYKLTVSDTRLQPTSAYLSRAMIHDKDAFKIYVNNSTILPEHITFNTLNNTGYWIDKESDNQVYLDDENILYHISKDNFFVIGDTYQLKAKILPTDTTDNSVIWTCANSTVAKVTSTGAVEARNVGETIAIVSTSNGLKARVIIEVVRNSNIHEVQSLTLEPSEITIPTSDKSAKYIVSAIIEPAFATYHTVEWVLDDAAAKLCKMTVIGNNKVEISEPTGNIGRGYVVATTQDGKSAKCLITTQHISEDTGDCREPCHDDQQV